MQTFVVHRQTFQGLQHTCKQVKKAIFLQKYYSFGNLQDSFLVIKSFKKVILSCNQMFLFECAFAKATTIPLKKLFFCSQIFFVQLTKFSLFPLGPSETNDFHAEIRTWVLAFFKNYFLKFHILYEWLKMDFGL
jgi:hypothetical protein